jgi:hypothetical protein
VIDCGRISSYTNQRRFGYISYFSSLRIKDGCEYLRPNEILIAVCVLLVLSEILSFRQYSES